MEVAIVWGWCLVLGVGAQTPATTGPGLTPLVPTQQNLQSALFSIDERLRALDSYYSVRYGGRWDVETYVRRLESIETRIGRVETLLELRTDKLLEAITSYQMKDTQTKEHINRKIDSLYDRLIHRIAYMENRIDTDVAKIQSSIESGFVRISRAERESEIVDVETQLHDLQRQFEEFERNQNQTLTLLLETFVRGSNPGTFVRGSNPGTATTLLNDDDGDREAFKREMEAFSTSMENVATKVNKMFNDLNHQSQSLEGLVKNSMSLTNATRREIQEGFKTLGHRKIVMQQGNKQYKEKEAASSLEGWDALSNLLSKEFGNLVRKMDSNYEELAKDHNLFIDGCHRVQENESQLEAEIASVLERILDRIHNRSHDMEKQVVALQEMLKTHNSNVIRTIGHSTNTAIQSSQQAKQLEATILQAVGEHRGLEKLSEGLTNVLAGIKVLQNQLGESPPSNVVPENVADACPKTCPDDSAIAEQILATILHRNSTAVVGNINTDTASTIIADKILSTLTCTQTGTRNTATQPNVHDSSVVADAYIERIIEKTLEVYKNRLDTNGDSRTRVHDHTEPKTENASAENSHVDITKLPSECRTSSNETDEGRTNGRRVDAVNNNARVLDIPANEEHVGETMAYNVTSDDVPIPARLFGADTIGAPMNRTAVGSADRKDDVERAETEPNADRDPIETLEGDRRESVAANAVEENADDLFSLTENGTEMPSDYDFERTSSELDRSEQLYYDDLTDEDEHAVKLTVNVTEVKVTEVNDTMETLKMSNVEINNQSVGSRPGIEEGAPESEFEVTVQVLNTPLNSNIAAAASFTNKSQQTTNTTDDVGLKISTNESDDKVNHTVKQFNQTGMNAGSQGEIANTADSKTSDPSFSSFWHRVVSTANGNESIETRTDLSRDDEKRRKGQEVEGNVDVITGGVNVATESRDDQTNDLDSEREPDEDAEDEFGSLVPPSR